MLPFDKIGYNPSRDVFGLADGLERNGKIDVHRRTIKEIEFCVRLRGKKSKKG